MNPRVSIIILNWNGWKDTIECLESLYRINYPNYDVIVVDNGSEDGSIDKIKEYCDGKIEVVSKFFKYSSKNKPIKIIEYTKEEAETGGKEEKISSSPPHKRLILIKNKKNYGFAKGNNIGIKYALKFLNPDYVLLLNNDTIIDKEFLNELVKVGENQKKIGILGAKIYSYNQPNKIQFTYAKINLWKGKAYHQGLGEIDKGQYNRIMTSDYIQGACFLIKQEVIKKIGLLNEKYYNYWEETDYCMRAKKAGYLSIYCPKAHIWHKIGQSANKISWFYNYYITRNRFFFMKQHATKFQYFSFLLYFFGFEFWLLSIIYFIRHKNINDFTTLLRGIVDGLIIRS